MIGADCKQLEENIEKFVSTFLRDKENIADKSCETLRHAITLYHLFKTIALNIRSTTYNALHAHLCQETVEKFFQTFKRYSKDSCTSGKPYLHILRDHFVLMLLFWGEYLNWAYGYFNCNGSEHLNKRIKCMEFGVTNLKDDRLYCIMHHLRVKQFYYPRKMLHIQKQF